MIGDSQKSRYEVLDEQIIYDDYLLICAGHAYLAHTQAYATGTHILTIKDAGPPK